MTDVATPPPGEDLDVRVAEEVLGWRRIAGPSYDYDGPCEHGDVLLPPTVAEDAVHNLFPPRGRIPLGFFVTSRYSTDISAAWTVVRHLRDRGWLVVVKEMPERHAFVMGDDPAADPKVDARCLVELSWMPTETDEDLRRRLHLNPLGIAETAPHAVCLAALQAAETVR